MRRYRSDRRSVSYTHLIIRFYSPLETIGGGKVLEVSPEKHKRFDDKTIAAMEIKDRGSDKDVAELVIKEKSKFFFTKGCLLYTAEIPTKHFTRDCMVLAWKLQY